jgi:hypothetical protein
MAISLLNISKLRTVEAKLGTMRKARRWTVNRRDDGLIVVQAEGAIGAFRPDTGRGLLNVRGGYYVHLAPSLGAKPFTFPPEFVAACIAACDHNARFQVPA